MFADHPAARKSAAEPPAFPRCGRLAARWVPGRMDDSALQCAAPELPAALSRVWRLHALLPDVPGERRVEHSSYSQYSRRSW